MLPSTLLCLMRWAARKSTSLQVSLINSSPRLSRGLATSSGHEKGQKLMHLFRSAGPAKYFSCRATALQTQCRPSQPVAQAVLQSAHHAKFSTSQSQLTFIKKLFQIRRQWLKRYQSIATNKQSQALNQDLDILLRVGKTTYRVLKMTFVSFCVLNSFITLVGFPACVYGKSMQPEFNAPSSHPGWKERDYLSANRNTFPGLDLDWVWVSCWKARSYSFQRGDIVVFVSPKEPYDYVIKRVVGLDGDVVRSHICEAIKTKVPEGHCWVEGDNWDNSVDSNKYGPIAKGLIFGVATHVIWPFHKMRALEEGVPSRLRPERVELREGDQQMTVSQQFDIAVHTFRNWWSRQVKVILYFLQG